MIKSFDTTAPESTRPVLSDDVVLPSSPVPLHPDSHRLLVEQLGDSVMVGRIDRDSHGRPKGVFYVEANAAALRSLGLTRDRVVGRSHGQVFPLADPRWVDKMAEVVVSGTPRMFRGWYPMAAGWRFHEYRCHRVGPDLVAIVTVDQTEIEDSRLHAKQSEQRLRLALDGPRQGIWDLDVAPALFTWDSRSTEILGLDRDTVISQTGFMQAVHPEDRESWLDACSAAMIDRGALEHEFRIVRPDGVERWVVMRGRALCNPEGTVDRISGTIVDVTEYRRSQEELRDYADRLRTVLEIAQRTETQLRHSERAFRSLAQNIPSALVRFDSCLRIVYLSPSGEQITGQPWPRVIGKTAREVGLPDDLCDALESTLSQVFYSGQPGELTFERMTSAGLRSYDLRLNLEPCDGHSLQTVLGVATDITQMRQAQADLAAANASLAEADRRKNEFLAILSHELRNPLAPIKNSLFVLGRAPAGGEQAKRALQVIERQTEQLSKLVDDLLDVTRITRNKVDLQLELLELNTLVRQAAEDHGWLFERGGIQLNVDLSSRVYVQADRTRMAQVVGNLLQNAAKFGARGTHALLTVGRDGPWAVIRVLDQGIGMASETLQRLFQPFMQAEASLDRSKGGLGLGLSLVRGLIELHGGDVRAFSRGVGQGTELVVRLPIFESASADLPRLCEPLTPPRRRVVIIEDNRDAADSLREALLFGGHEVNVAHSGVEGIALVRELRPDVVLCDIGLPGIDGYEVARTIRADQRLRNVHLVALTGYALAEDVRRAATAGFDCHIAKPPSLERLDEVLNQLSWKP